MDKNLSSNVVWAFAGQLGYILVGLAGTLVLARLLTPTDFGVVGIAMFFVGISNVLIESGMGGALVRKENASEADYSTVFIFNLAISIFLALLLISFSGFIATFYELPKLRYILFALSSLLIINAFTITQNARLVKEMKFKERGFYKLVSLLLAVIVSVVLAFFDFGVWAIVFLQVLSAFFLLVILLIKEGGIGKLMFSKDSFKEMSSFGIFTTLSSLLNAVFDNIYQLILGRYFSVSQVGFYYQAKKLQEAPDTIYKLLILQVVYSHLSKLQNNLKDFRFSYNNIAKFCAIALGLTTCLTFSYAKEIVLLLYGSKWEGSVFFLQILVIVGFFTLQEMVNRNIFKIFNETHKILYLELLKKSIQSVSIIVGIYQNSIEILLYGFVLTSLFSYFVNFYYTRKIVNDISKSEIINFVKILFSSLLTTIFILLLLRTLSITGLMSLLFVPIFVLIYFLLLYLLRVENLFRLIKKFIFKK